MPILSRAYTQNAFTLIKFCSLESLLLCSIRMKLIWSINTTLTLWETFKDWSPDNPLSKHQFKSLMKKKVISYWECTLRAEVVDLSSLEFFNPQFMSLTKGHPLWSTAGASPGKVRMATIQATMLSGRYRTGSLTRFWTENSSGQCQLSPTCLEKETLTHLLSHCSSLKLSRARLLIFTARFANDHPEVAELLLSFCLPLPTILKIGNSGTIRYVYRARTPSPFFLFYLYRQF